MGPLQMFGTFLHSLSVVLNPLSDFWKSLSSATKWAFPLCERDGGWWGNSDEKRKPKPALEAEGFAV